MTAFNPEGGLPRLIRYSAFMPLPNILSLVASGCCPICIIRRQGISQPVDDGGRNRIVAAKGVSITSRMPEWPDSPTPDGNA